MEANAPSYSQRIAGEQKHTSCSTLACYFVFLVLIWFFGDVPLLMQSLSKNEKIIKDPEIMAWANSKVYGFSIGSFADPSLSTGVYLLQVGLLLFRHI